MYLYHNDALPISFTQIFQTGNKIHQYLTRYSDFYRPHTCRTNIFDIFWSEIGSEFGEPGGTPPPRIPRT